MLRTPRMQLVALALACAAGAGATAEQPVELTPRNGPLLGFLLDPDQAIEPPPVPGEAESRAPIVRLETRWADIEHFPGTYDWTAIAPAVDALHGTGFRTVLALTGSHPHYLPDGGPPSPLMGRSLEAWLEFVRSATRTFAGRVAVFELGGTPPDGSDDDANVQALVLKQSALMVRAEAGGRGAEVLIAQGALSVGALDWQRELWEREVAAYVDILPLIIDVADDLDGGASRVRTVFEESLKYPPASTLWAYVRGGSGWDAPGLAVAALTSGASAALFRPADPEQIQWANGFQRTLDEGYAPAALGELRLDYGAEPAPARARVLGRFFNEQDFTTLVVYHAPGAEGEVTEVQLDVDARVIRNVRVLNPLTAKTKRVRNTPDDDGQGRALHVGVAPSPRAALFQKRIVTPGFELPAEDLEVASERGLTAEEIIARFQLLQQDQDDRLDRWMAKGRIDFHFKLAQGTSTVDVSIDSNYFWERDGHLEWEQTGYYINGNKVRWKNIPELPLIQPEKVITLPLDLTLDKTYSYRLAGDERVAGRDAYVIAFEPSAPDPALSLYRGRLWIDKETFARVKASVIQNNLEPPVLANEEIDRFELRTGTDGKPYWMFASIDGQQVWNAAGRNFVVRRELTFSDYEINPPRAEFEVRRGQAYASRNQMLQDTDQGFRYLERQADGTRTVKLKQDTSQLFAAGGAFKDDSLDNVVPLAGVNYFNYNLWGKNIQFNALFAGVLGFVTASKPTLGGTRMDFSVDVGLNGLKLDDKVYEGDDEIEAERIENRSQSFALRLGVPAGQFVKFNFIGGLAFRQYFDSDDGEDAIDDYNLANMANLEFVLPEDHLQVTGTAEVEFNRRGYNLTGAYARASRSDWESWGLFDPDADAGNGAFGTLVDGVFTTTGGEPVADDFTRWRVSAAKEWYLPKFQKIRGAVDYLNGSDLDRFSRYEFSFFGNDQLNGFSGSGVRFDEGVIGRIGYAFNLFEVIRLDAAIDSARVEQNDSADGEQSFTGVGLSGNFIGPWKTVINVNYGYAISSDVSDLEGQQEFLVLVLKLF
jgi:hypothetical protein